MWLFFELLRISRGLHALELWVHKGKSAITRSAKKIMKKKPDALMVLALVFGLGVLVSSITHSGSTEQADQARLAVSAGIDTVPARQ